MDVNPPTPDYFHNCQNLSDVIARIVQLKDHSILFNGPTPQAKDVLSLAILNILKLIACPQVLDRHFYTITRQFGLRNAVSRIFKADNQAQLCRAIPLAVYMLQNSPYASHAKETMNTFQYSAQMIEQDTGHRTISEAISMRLGLRSRQLEGPLEVTANEDFTSFLNQIITRCNNTKENLALSDGQALGVFLAEAIDGMEAIKALTRIPAEPFGGQGTHMH